MSYGNSWTEIPLEFVGLTIVSGKNGDGKSTISVAIFFALTGLALIEVSKGGLVNIFNDRDCLVELEFESGGHSYMVRRGVRPNVFGIYKDGELVPEDGKRVNFYQDKLDEIVGIPPALLRSVLLINYSSRPFFKMSKGERREFLDKIFGLEKFNIMAEMVKRKLSEISASMSLSSRDLVILKSKLEHQKETLNNYDKMVATAAAKSNTDKSKIEADVLSKISDSMKAKSKLELAKEVVDITNKKVKETSLNKENLKNSKKELISIKEKLKEAEEAEGKCRLCGQVLPKEVTELEKIRVEKLKQTILNLEVSIKEIEKLDCDTESANKTSLTATNELRKTESDVAAAEALVSAAKDRLEEYSFELPEPPKIDITETETKIKENELSSKKMSNIESHLKSAYKILMDEEIKSFIVGKYVPFLNSQVAFFLEMFGFDFDVMFTPEMDYRFISKTRGKKELEYGNFSRGQRTRLDIAMIFAFINVYKMVSFKSMRQVTNLIIFDEFIDMGTDADGVEDCLKMMTEVSRKWDTGFMVISHKVDAESTDFPVYMAKMQSNGFSKIEKVQ